MDILPVSDQLISRLDDTEAFHQISAALDLSALDDSGKLRAISHAWVLEVLTEPGQNTEDTDRPHQIEKQLFVVVIGLKSVNDENGERAQIMLREKRLVVRKALYGFTPLSNNQSYEPLLLAGSKLIQLTPSAVYWAERFSTTHVINQENLL